MSINEVKTKLKRYAEVLRQNKIAFSNLYLFGSYCSGQAKADSDIDVAVIMQNTGTNANAFELESKLWILAPKVDARIEPFLLAKKDLSGARATMMGVEVIKRGIRII